VDTEPVYIIDGSELRAAVLSGDLVAGYLSEGTPGSDAEVERFETGIVSPRVILFRKDDVPTCGFESLSELEIAEKNISSDHLSQALNAAITSLVTKPEWFVDLRTKHGFASALSIASCSPSETAWGYPKMTSATGLLARVLSTGKLTVAGVQWAQGGVADYKTDPLKPTGFWVEYLDSIVAVISDHYKQNITVERKYYANSDLVNEAVDNGGEVDMSEPYYYLGGFLNNRPRIDVFEVSCMTAGTGSMFFVKKESGLTSTTELVKAMTVAGANVRVGFLAVGNYHSVSSLLPADTVPVYITDGAQLRAAVMDGNLAAGFLSEGTPGSDLYLERFETGIISPRTILLRKDRAVECLSKTEASGSAQHAPTLFALALLVALAAVM
jgi:hypothetical protein